jgi:hypothetical protein
MSDTKPDIFADRRQAMLQRLAELGMMLAERLATEAEPTETTALQFARLAKAVRQTLALEAELAGALEIKAAAQRAAPVPVWERRGMTEAQWDLECREEERLNDADDLIHRLVDRDPRERLRDELHADREELVHELSEAGVFAGDIPLTQIIERIARDLGLSPDWHGLTRDEWGALDLGLRIQLKAGVVLGEDPPGWPRLAKPRPAPRTNGVHPPDLPP